MRFIWDCTKLFAYVPFQGYHGQGKYLENDFFQVREKSGNFVDGQGNLEMTCGHMPFNTSCPLCFSFVLYSFCFVVGVVLSGEPKQNQGRGLVDRRTLVQAPPPPPTVISSLAFPRRLLCFGSLVTLYVARCY